MQPGRDVTHRSTGGAPLGSAPTGATAPLRSAAGCALAAGLLSLVGGCSMLFDVGSPDETNTAADARPDDPSDAATPDSDAGQSGRFDATPSPECDIGFSFDSGLPLAANEGVKFSYSYPVGLTHVNLAFEGPGSVVATGPEDSKEPTGFTWAYGIEIETPGSYRALFSGLEDGSPHNAQCDFEVTAQ